MEHTQRAPTDHVEYLFESGRLERVMTTHGKYGDPFSDPNLSHQDIEVIQYSRMISHFASSILENEAMVRSVSWFFTQGELEAVVDGALFFESAVRGDYEFDEIMETDLSESLTVVTMPGEKMVHDGPYKHMDPILMDDLFGQDNQRPESPTETAAVLGWVIGGLSTSSVVVSLIRKFGDEQKTIAEFTKPPNIDGFITIDDLIDKRMKGSRVSRLWCIKYYAAYIRNPSKKTAFETMKSVAILAVTNVNAYAGTILGLMNSAMNAYAEPSANALATKSLQTEINKCGDSENVAATYKILVDNLATLLAQAKEKVPPFVTRWGGWRDSIPYVTTNPILGSTTKALFDAATEERGGIRPLGLDHEAMKDAVKTLLEYDPSTNAPRLLNEVSDTLINRTQLEKQLKIAAKDAKLDTAMYKAVVRGLGAKLWNKESSVCAVEAVEEASRDVDPASQAGGIAVDRQSNSTNITQAITLLGSLFNVYTIYDAIYFANRQQTVVRDGIINSYVAFVAGDLTMSVAKQTTPLDRVIEADTRCIPELTRLEDKHLFDTNASVAVNRETKSTRDSISRTINNQRTKIRLKAEELARDLERHGENETSVNELLYSFARNCAQFVINIRNEISKLETRAAKAYYIKQKNEFVATPPQITSARDWLVKEEQDRKARRPKTPDRSTKRPQQAQRTRALAPDGTPLLSIDEIVDRFKASRLGRSGTGP